MPLRSMAFPLLLLGTVVAVEVQMAPEDCGGGSCPAAQTPMTAQDHLLLQMRATSVAAAVQRKEPAATSREEPAATSHQEPADAPQHQEVADPAEATAEAARHQERADDAQPQGEADGEEDQEPEDSQDDEGLSTKSDAEGLCVAVRRRRRAYQMRSCRRRHSSAGWHDTDSQWDQWQCNEATNQMECSTSRAPGGAVPGRYPSGGGMKAAGLWCQVPIPPNDWSLKSCPASGRGTTVKVLTYNLFWWNLFRKYDGGGRSAGKLIAQTSGPEQYDIMGFQECEDRWRVINEAKAEGLAGDYETLDGGKAIAIAYLKSRWSLLAYGAVDVGEDSRAQYYGKRAAQWVRLQHTDGQTIFFLNHHGPLRVSEGGGCTGSATALNILRVIAENAQATDAIVVVGDFNAEAHSSRIREMDRRLRRVFSGSSMGGVDHVFSNCEGSGNNLGKGRGWRGSDHDALSATFHF